MDKNIQIYTDGGSRGNPGNAGVGVVVFLDNQVTHSYSNYIGIATNNVAEYSAFIYSLDWIIANHPTANKIFWYMDSLLVVNQVNKLWKIKDQDLLLLANQSFTKLAKIGDFGYVLQIQHIGREKNTIADGLVNQALDRVLSRDLR